MSNKGTVLLLATPDVVNTQIFTTTHKGKKFAGIIRRSLRCILWNLIMKNS